MSDPIWSLVANQSTRAAAASGGSTRSQQTTKDPNSLGKDAFMRLLLTQMQSQDPLTPMDGQAFFTQLAQLSLLEQMYQLNDTLQSSQRQQQLVQAGTLIGKTVEYNNDSGTSVSGVVSGAHVLDNEVFVDVDGTSVPLSEVTAVHAGGADDE